MKEKILNVLMNTTGFVSGQELSEQLGVSRTAIWKVIRQLEEEGYVFEAVNRKGYRLMSAPDRITELELSGGMPTEIFGRQICYYPELGSTNNQARLLAEQGAVHGTLVVTEVQSSGKGRRGRSWVSPAGSGIWMTLIMRPKIEPVNASMLTLVAALAVAQGLQKFGFEAGIKWPNDIVIDGKKVCGILTEMSADMDEINYVVTGIGINVNITQFPEELTEKATSLVLAGGKAIRRADLIQAIMQQFERYYQIFIADQNFSHLQQEYNDRLVNRGREVRIVESENEQHGQCRGIDDYGRLLVVIDGIEQQIVAGEVSVRGMLGYS